MKEKLIILGFTIIIWVTINVVCCGLLAFLGLYAFSLLSGMDFGLLLTWEYLGGSTIAVYVLSCLLPRTTVMKE